MLRDQIQENVRIAQRSLITLRAAFEDEPDVGTNYQIDSMKSDSQTEPREIKISIFWITFNNNIVIYQAILWQKKCDQVHEGPKALLSHLPERDRDRTGEQAVQW